MKATRLIVLLLLMQFVLAGCASNRLKGPIYAADGPPWLADEVQSGAAPIELVHRVILIGDSGIFLEEDPTLGAVGRWTDAASSSTVIFLGDNIYNEGLVDDDREAGERVLTQLLRSTNAPKIFIPGNHDWGFSPKGQNLDAIVNQQGFIEGWSQSPAEFIPRNGCMGPTTRVLHDAPPGRRDIVLVAVDPTPWINPRLREACRENAEKALFLLALDRELERHADDFVIVSSHYPMRTGGPHGGLTYGFLGDMITSVLGSMWGGLMNTYEPEYADWIASTQDVFRKHPPLVYAAGHDHSLQLLDAEDFARLEIVSGAGARDRVSTVTNIEPTIFAHAAEGFVALDFGMRDGEQVVVVRVIEAAVADPVFEMDVP